VGVFVYKMGQFHHDNGFWLDNNTCFRGGVEVNFKQGSPFSKVIEEDYLFSGFLYSNLLQAVILPKCHINTNGRILVKIA